MNMSRNWIPEQFILKDERTFLTHRSESEKNGMAEDMTVAMNVSEKGSQNFHFSRLVGSNGSMEPNPLNSAVIAMYPTPFPLIKIERVTL